MRAHRLGQLHAHVAESAQADNAHLHARTDLGAAQRRVGRNTGAEQRRRSGQVQVGGNAQDEVLIDHHALGISAIGDRRGLMLVGRVVGEGGVRAELLDPGLAAGQV